MWRTHKSCDSCAENALSGGIAELNRFDPPSGFMKDCELGTACTREGDKNLASFSLQREVSCVPASAWRWSALIACSVPTAKHAQIKISISDLMDIVGF